MSYSKKIAILLFIFPLLVLVVFTITTKKTTKPTNHSNQELHLLEPILTHNIKINQLAIFIPHQLWINKIQQLQNDIQQHLQQIDNPSLKKILQDEQTRNNVTLCGLQKLLSYQQHQIKLHHLFDNKTDSNLIQIPTDLTADELSQKLQIIANTYQELADLTAQHTNCFSSQLIFDQQNIQKINQEITYYQDSHKHYMNLMTMTTDKELFNQTEKEFQHTTNRYLFHNSNLWLKQIQQLRLQQWQHLQSITQQ